MSDPLVIVPLARPPDATVRVPGSKSLTNRALLCAGLSRGTTVLLGALAADDTESMGLCLRAAGVAVDWQGSELVVTGHGRFSQGGGTLDAGLSGTTARFMLPVLAASPGRWVLDGGEALRRRPFGALVDAVRALGGDVRDGGRPGSLPLAVWGTLLEGGTVEVAGDVTSQFVSALLLAGPLLTQGIELYVAGPASASPYVAMTATVMSTFGADVEDLRVGPGQYRSPGRFVVEPDASAASYVFAAAAVTGGRVTVADLGSASVQGDAHFVEVLARMGCTVERHPHTTTVQGAAAGMLHGVDVDLATMPDMAQTLAAVAVFADAPTRVRGVGVIRGHETNRIRAVVTELQRLGIEAHEHDDGFTVVPGTPSPGVVQTYEDHRMAMAFTVIGLRASGIAIGDPGCVAKTFPTFFEVIDELRAPSNLRRS